MDVDELIVGHSLLGDVLAPILLYGPDINTNYSIVLPTRSLSQSQAEKRRYTSDSGASTVSSSAHF